MKSQINIKKCINCNKEFKRIGNKNKGNKYCSLSCVFEHRRKISKSLPINKITIIERAKNKCEECGIERKLHIHHINKAEYHKNGHSPLSGEQNNPKNLIALCIFCHRKLHSKGVKRFTNKGKCIACGKEFYYYPKANRGKYCSRECAYKNCKLKFEDYIPKINTCKYCGLAFVNKREKMYCSNKCKSRWYYYDKK